MTSYHFLDDNAAFTMISPEETSGLYFPLAGERGLKSAVAPNLGGDSKVDQEGFLFTPVSIDDLHSSRSTRNFWCLTEKGFWSATGVSAEQEAARFGPAQDKSSLTAGFGFHTVRRQTAKQGLRTAVTTFVPPEENVEISLVRITNTTAGPQTLTLIAALPIYGRSADNLRDHRNVTSMLHRIRTVPQGVVVQPTMSFDEKGHRPNTRLYYVLGQDGDGACPAAFFPTVESFIGEGGTLLHPRAVVERRPGVSAGTAVDGREAMGGLRFAAVRLAPGESADYVVLAGIAESAAELERVWNALGDKSSAGAALRRTRQYWQDKVNVRYHTGSRDFDRLLRWVSYQPFLRRLYGCSFLPHHDYGRGGRGWRDLWQDCLSLLLMDPDGVGAMIRANFGGVRIDGTNATIIGSGDGNFIADRNGIARVWMDHALWPLMTVRLYVDQTGDLSVLEADAPYFKDAQTARGTAADEQWAPQDGSVQRTVAGAVYTGSVLEHLLIEHLTSFYEVGGHNLYRLRGADWNDALDMAAVHGESVAFSCAYAGNLRDLAALLRQWAKATGAKKLPLLRELEPLFTAEPALYNDAAKKRALLAEYAAQCCHTVRGERIEVPVRRLADDLDSKAAWLTAHIRKREWLDAGGGLGWFNSYYDDHGRPLEHTGENPQNPKMMLTGQVFAVMGSVATDAQVRAITRAADKYLYRPGRGGYCLNTDFRELKFDMGRMFGFAYGEKENGAVFSHMAVMYANALYRRGFVHEGYRALQALADAALDFNTSRIYPGIPEYFNIEGRGMYHYLTGAASWYMLTVITQAFGVRGELGDLVIAPRLVKEQFDESGKADISLTFAGKALQITFANLSGADVGAYRIIKANIVLPENSRVQPLAVQADRALLPRAVLAALPQTGCHIMVELV